MSGYISLGSLFLDNHGIHVIRLGYYVFMKFLSIVWICALEMMYVYVFVLCLCLAMHVGVFLPILWWEEYVVTLWIRDV